MPDQEVNEPPEDVMILVNLSEHLDALKVAEAQKPPSLRRRVPSIATLAREAEIGRTTLYQIAGNTVQSINRHVLASVIKSLRKRGFPVSVSDLIKEYPIVSEE